MPKQSRERYLTFLFQIYRFPAEVNTYLESLAKTDPTQLVYYTKDDKSIPSTRPTTLLSGYIVYHTPRTIVKLKHISTHATITPVPLDTQRAVLEDFETEHLVLEYKLMVKPRSRSLITKSLSSERVLSVMSSLFNAEQLEQLKSRDIMLYLMLEKYVHDKTNSQYDVLLALPLCLPLPTAC